MGRVKQMARNFKQLAVKGTKKKLLKKNALSKGKISDVNMEAAAEAHLSATGGPALTTTTVEKKKKKLSKKKLKKLEERTKAEGDDETMKQTPRENPNRLRVEDLPMHAQLKNKRNRLAQPGSTSLPGSSVIVGRHISKKKARKLMKAANYAERDRLNKEAAAAAEAAT